MMLVLLLGLVFIGCCIDHGCLRIAQALQEPKRGTYYVPR